ncbi:MAG: AbrB/MazE/SpoVT family DNA-binding domain-containing protein [Nitrospirae bacterium]|nr:AbrB/MazE/SpoVT family DNA-binding domain-containing protein [Nitrospirota bacterium]
MTALAKVTSKGQITLPKEVRESLHIRTGSIVVFEKDGERLIVDTARQKNLTVQSTACRRYN